MTWFVPSPILVQPSSLTFRRRSRRIVSTCFLCSFALKKFFISWLNLPSWWVITACLTNWFGYFMKCDLEYDFQDLEKMPKHVEMVRTKFQPKSWDGQNANQRKKSGQNANLWLALCPVGILSGRHFVLPPSLMGSRSGLSIYPQQVLGPLPKLQSSAFFSWRTTTTTTADPSSFELKYFPIKITTNFPDSNFPDVTAFPFT